MGGAMKTDSGDPIKEPGKEAGIAQREVRTCPACGSKFSSTGDGRFCPVCILRRVVSGKSALAEALNPASGLEDSSGEAEADSPVHRLENYELMLDRNGSRSSWVVVLWV